MKSAILLNEAATKELLIKGEKFEGVKEGESDVHKSDQKMDTSKAIANQSSEDESNSEDDLSSQEKKKKTKPDQAAKMAT